MGERGASDFRAYVILSYMVEPFFKTKKQRDVV